MSHLIGNPAPHFEAKAVVNGQIVDGFTLSRYRGKYVVFFFYPLDFTFVCPTELHAFQDAAEEFAKRNCELVACSIDSHYSHHAWLNTSRDKGGIEGCTFPIVSDINKTIARDYGVLHPSEGVAYRGLFLMDKEGIIRHMLINDLPLGRSVDDALRVVDALSFFEQNGEVCPANWQKGNRGMKPTEEGLKEYFTQPQPAGMA
jgi:peroxiredoxin (alkyl hydroperoxide reductase subunit C)